MDSQMQKGVLEMCLLGTIASQETYGYDLLSKMTEAFPDLQERTVYAILRRLNAGGYTQTYEGSGTKGPVRKYYRITELGNSRLEMLKNTWQDLLRSVAQSGI